MRGAFPLPLNNQSPRTHRPGLLLLRGGTSRRCPVKPGMTTGGAGMTKRVCGDDEEGEWRW